MQAYLLAVYGIGFNRPKALSKLCLTSVAEFFRSTTIITPRRWKRKTGAENRCKGVVMTTAREWDTVPGKSFGNATIIYVAPSSDAQTVSVTRRLITFSYKNNERASPGLMLEGNSIRSPLSPVNGESVTPIVLTLHCEPQTMLRWLSETCAYGFDGGANAMAARRARSVINNLELIKVSDKSMETVMPIKDNYNI
ncbi:hypothetical protein WN51_02895 [Melipona quadrifasciata]|uniref:Uncharacterized protein n=1 Tax=Melipona quadrifasciata TaxID=166423 RepID=A0A0M9ABA0_9HYME|nr:hypothetical protein WN51_02895 [Melipona quadrifasciata]